MMMMMMRQTTTTTTTTVLLISSILLLSTVSSFVPSHGGSAPHRQQQQQQQQRGVAHQLLKVSTPQAATDTNDADNTIDIDSNNPMKLTPELLKIANAFQAIGDDKLRYKQLLYMANQLSPLDASKQIPSNKVPGCLSTVYIDVKPCPTTSDDDSSPLKIQYEGDSDGLLTKGLVALLIRGLSGNTAADIAAVDPAFVQTAGIAASLTPGRNNGFLNMLATMKNKALQLEEEIAYSKSQKVQKEKEEAGVVVVDAATATDSGNNNQHNNGPMYTAIMQALQALQPDTLELEDVSYQHAGHAEAGDGESHFDLYVVADAFEGLNLVKRHQLIYMMLGQVMPNIHALQIRAKTPAEV